MYSKPIRSSQIQSLSFKLPLSSYIASFIALNIEYFVLLWCIVLELASISPAVYCSSIFQESNFIFHILEVNPVFTFQYQQKSYNFF